MRISRRGAEAQRFFRGISFDLESGKRKAESDLRKLHVDELVVPVVEEDGVPVFHRGVEKVGGGVGGGVLGWWGIPSRLLHCLQWCSAL